MNEPNIENPTRTIKYSLTWVELKKHIEKVVQKFPKEYKVIKEDQPGSTLTILYNPANVNRIGINNDLLLHIKATAFNIDTEVDFVATNQYGKIASYTEEEQHKKSLQFLTVLTEKSIKGTLNAAAKKTISPQVKTQAILQVIVIIAALIAIVYGLFAILK